MAKSLLLAAGTLAVLTACGPSSGDSGGSGGSTAGIGGSQAGSGGRGGTAGTSGTGGTGGANTGGTGGANTGGTGGATGGTGGTGGAGTGGTGGAADARTEGGMPPASFLDECFAGLRTLASRSQTSDRTSSNGAYRVRLAIEYPPGSVGTSGTFAWEAVRVGIVTPQRQVCIKDEAALANAYRGSRHNCSDVLVVMSGGLMFEIKPPDVAPDRPVTTLAVTGEAAIPAVMLPTVTCTGTNGAPCTTGGPCQ